MHEEVEEVEEEVLNIWVMGRAISNGAMLCPRTTRYVKVTLDNPGITSGYNALAQAHLMARVSQDVIVILTVQELSWDIIVTLTHSNFNS